MPDYGILFSPDTTTEVELIYTNVGSELLEIDCQVITDLPRVGVSHQIKTTVQYFPLVPLTWEITTPNDAIYTDLMKI